MSRRRFRLSHLVVLAFLLGSLSHLSQAQTDSSFEMGLKPYGSYHGGDIDVVNLNNTKVDLHAPLFSYPQRGKLHMGFALRYSNPTAELVCIKDPQHPGSCLEYLWLWLPAVYGAGYEAGVQIIPDIQMGYKMQDYGTPPADVKVYSVLSADGSSHQIPNGTSAGGPRHRCRCRTRTCTIRRR